MDQPIVTITVHREHGVYRAVVDTPGSPTAARVDCARIDELLRDIGVDLSVALGERQG